MEKAEFSLDQNLEQFKPQYIAISNNFKLKLVNIKIKATE